MPFALIMDPMALRALALVTTVPLTPAVAAARLHFWVVALRDGLALLVMVDAVDYLIYSSRMPRHAAFLDDYNYG